jgi:DNA-binding transcriptional LysR family regulator
VTLDQARVLDALARHGTLQRAATALGKGHSSVIYALKTLEDAIGRGTGCGSRRRETRC